MKNPLLSCLYLVKKRLFCQNYTLLFSMGQKSQEDLSIRCPFFPIFHEKYLLSCPYTVKKNVHSLKNTMLLFSYFVKKTSILSKTRGSYVLFFNIVMKTPLLSCPYLVKKYKICQKYAILWAKKVNWKK